MKKLILLAVIFNGIITITQAQSVHNEWVDDSITYVQDNEHYLVKIFIMQDSLVSKSTQLSKTTEVYQKILIRERLEKLPKELWEYTSLEINNAIKQDHTIGLVRIPMYENSRNKFSNGFFPTVYQAQYKYGANGFGLVHPLNLGNSILVMMITFQFTYTLFLLLRCILAYKRSRKKQNLFFGLVYLCILILFLYQFFIPSTKTTLSLWYFVTVVNAFILFLGVLWLRNKVRGFKEENKFRKELT